MPKDKKSKKDIIEILHQILDNPHDPKFKASTFEENKNLDSIRKRLSGESLKTDRKYISSDFLPKKYDSLEPRVTIYQKEEKITPPEIKKLEPGERAEEVKDEFHEEDLFDDVDLYEIEKVDISEPEFLEVRPKETTKKQEEVSEEAEVFLPVPEPVEKEKTKDMKVADEELPEWESVEETKPEEAVEKKEGKISEEFPEFEKIDEEAEPQPPSGETEEEIPTWEPVSEERVKEEIVELPEESKEEKPSEEGIEKISKEKEKESRIARREREQQKVRILSFLKERKRKKKEREEQKSEELGKKGSKKISGEIVIGDKESEENILKKLEAKAEWREVKEITGDVEKEAIEWESEEETKPEETVEKKEGKISEFEKIDEEAEPQPPSGETEEEIPTWEPVSEERVKEEIVELPEESKEEKPPEEGIEKISKEKEKESRIAEKERLAELKRQEREEQRLKKIEAKRALIEARKKEKEAEKAKKEKERKLREKQKEKQRLKIIEEKKALIEAREKEKESRIAEKERLSELKKRKKEQRAKEKVVSPSKSISEVEELTEWASYDAEEEIPDIDSTAEFYKHGDYTLYMKEIKTPTGKKRTIHFFSKKKPDLGEAIPLPEGYKVMINKKTKLPYLRKKK